MQLTDSPPNKETRVSIFPIGVHRRRSIFCSIAQLYRASSWVGRVIVVICRNGFDLSVSFAPLLLFSVTCIMW